MIASFLNLFFFHSDAHYREIASRWHTPPPASVYYIRLVLVRCVSPFDGGMMIIKKVTIISSSVIDPHVDLQPQPRGLLCTHIPDAPWQWKWQWAAEQRCFIHRRRPEQKIRNRFGTNAKWEGNACCNWILVWPITFKFWKRMLCKKKITLHTLFVEIRNISLKPHCVEYSYL